MGDHLSSIRPILAAEIGQLRQVVGDLSDHELVLGTSCVGWRVADLIVHLRMSCEAVLMSLSDFTGDEPDRDFVTYWHDWPPAQPPGFGEVRFTWASSAAYRSGEGLKSHFDDTARAAMAAVHSSPDGSVRFQGHVMRIADLAGMWTTEFTVHHLDLLDQIDRGVGPTEDALRVTAAALDALHQAPRPTWWDVSTYILKSTGRAALRPEERTRLGPGAATYPAFG